MSGIVLDPLPRLITEHEAGCLKRLSNDRVVGKTTWVDDDIGVGGEGGDGDVGFAGVQVDRLSADQHQR